MAERFLPRVVHSMAHPFVEGGRRVSQAGSDMLDGGRRKRIDAQYGQDVRDNRVLDFSRAIGPMALLFGTLGFSAPLAVETIREIVEDMNTVGGPTSELNWWVAIIGTGVGFVAGAVINAEHSRRVGRDWRIDSEEALKQFREWVKNRKF